MRIIAMVFLVSACGAASDVASSETPAELNLFELTTVVIEVNDDSLGVSSTTAGDIADTTPDSTEPGEQATTTTTATSTPATEAPSATGGGPTIPVVDPNAEFCQAAVAIADLGTFVALDDSEAANSFFNAQADRWEAAAGVAPASIAADVTTVATFVGELRTLLAANDFDLFAVFAQVTELESTSGSDIARIRADQFIYANCEVSPPLPEQATAAFYIGLLDSAENRGLLAELLASAELFTLDGARCFVDQVTPDAIHPLVGAPATAAQDDALSAALSTCQLSIGT